MSILMPSDTRAAIGPKAEKCASRSLFMDRFADPEAKETDRRNWFNQLLKKPADTAGLRAGFLSPNAVSFYAQLRSRLMVDMAGGVMENAGLCLDRFGLPSIPGSAVKGCARRMAIQELLEMREESQLKSISERAQVLADIALVFGWGDTDWDSARVNKHAKLVADFVHAVGLDDWSEVSRAAKDLLTRRISQGFPAQIAGQVSFFAGTVVDASGIGLPIAAPSPGKLELDVLTSHHQKYYKGELATATDTEDPIPVFFPAVAAGHVFAFSVAPLRGCNQDTIEKARAWLEAGLELFGIGAKTAAGYGWFNVSDSLQETISKALSSRLEREREAHRKAEQDRRLKLEEADRIRMKQADKARCEAMSSEEKEDDVLARKDPNQLLQWIEKFEKHTDGEKAAIYRLLQSRNPDLWRELRDKAESGKKRDKKRFTPIVQAVFKMAKNRKEKMPK